MWKAERVEQRRGVEVRWNGSVESRQCGVVRQGSWRSKIAKIVGSTLILTEGRRRESKN